MSKLGFVLGDLILEKPIMIVHLDYNSCLALMNKFDRVFSTLILLQSKKVVKASAIAERFEISLRTVYRDISTLKNAGIPIIGDPGIGYSIMEGYRLPPIMFNQGEATALLTAEKFIGKLTDKQTQSYYSSAMEKVKSILRAPEKETVEILDNTIAIAHAKKSVENPFLASIFESLATKNCLEIKYMSAGGELSARRIEPLGCYHSITDWYLVAYCQLKSDYRTFKLDRIKKLIALDKPITRNHINIQTYIDKQDQAWRDAHQLQTIKISFKKSLVRYAERRKHFFGFVEQQEFDDSIEMTFLNANIEFVARWLIQFGDQASVIIPAELNDRMKTLAFELYAHYYKEAVQEK